MPNTIDVVNFSPRALTFSSGTGIGVDTIQTSVPETGPISTDSVTPAARKNLHEHLQAAVSLELQTIPLYLYAAYSIKKPGPASWSIMNVVKQEMLHLALSGNILRAIGGDPILYHPKTDNHSFVPEYPDEMLYQDITLNLESANKRSLRTFMELERPDPELNLVDEATVRQFKIYASIGAFYKAVALELSDWNASSDTLFFPETINWQFSFEDGSWYDESMVIIKDIDSAQAAVTTITEQGEGSTKSPPLPKSPNNGRVLEPTPPVAHKSHFEVFKDLSDGTKLDCHNFIKNPKTSDLAPPQAGDPPRHKAYPVLVACDAAYCYMLISIEKVWDPRIDANTRSKLVANNLRNIMSNILRPLATFLTEQSYGNFKLAPFFNFYEFKTDLTTGDGTVITCHMQLQSEMDKAVEKFPELANIGNVVKNLVPVNYRGWPRPLGSGAS